VRNLTWLRIANRTDRRISLHWIDDAEVRHFHAEVLPRTTRTQAATPGRPWAIVEPDGRERAVYYPDSVARRIVVDDPASHLLERSLRPPPGMSMLVETSGAISAERILPDGRVIWAPDVDVLDEFDAAAGAVVAFEGDGRRMRIMMWDFPDAAAAGAFASKLIGLYAAYIPRIPGAAAFDVPDGSGVSGIFGGGGNGALGVCTHGAIGLVALVVGGVDEVEAVRSALAEQRGRLT
jgi:hypothetical protein